MLDEEIGFTYMGSIFLIFNFLIGKRNQTKFLKTSWSGLELCFGHITWAISGGQNVTKKGCPKHIITVILYYKKASLQLLVCTRESIQTELWFL